MNEGWWFVNSEDDQGWEPGSFLQREDGVKENMKIRIPPGKEEQYLSTDVFKAQMDSELSMEQGAIVDVIEKSLKLLDRYKGQTENLNIKRHSKQSQQNQASSVVDQSLSPAGPQIVKNLSEISDLFQPSTSTVQHSTALDELGEDDKGHGDPEDLYSIVEISKILKKNNQDLLETEEVNANIHNMKLSMKSHGSMHSPPKLPEMNSSQEGVKSTKSKYVTVAAFSNALADGISFKAGQTVQVLEKSESGWWYIVIDDQEGWAPASYIQDADAIYSVVNKQAPSSVLTSRINRNPDSAQEMMGDITKPKHVMMEKPKVTEKPNAQEKPIATEKIEGDIEKFTTFESSCAPAVKNKKSIVDGLSGVKPAGQPLPPPDKIKDTTRNQAPCFKTAVIAKQKTKPQVPAKVSTININCKLEKNKMPEDRIQNNNDTVFKTLKPTKPNNIDVNSKFEKKTLLEDKIVPSSIARNLINMQKMKDQRHAGDKDQRHAGDKKQCSYPALPPKPKNILDTNVSSAESKQINKFPIGSPLVKQMGDCKKLTAQEWTVCENSASSKVTELIKALQVKFGNSAVEESLSSNANDHKDAAVTVRPNKQFSKPIQFIIPPTKGTGQGEPRLDSLTSQDSIKLLDPKKYLSQPVAPDPKSTAYNDDELEGSKQLTVTPIKPHLRPKITNPVTDSRDGKNHHRHLEESGFANDKRVKVNNAIVNKSKEIGDNVSKVENIVSATTDQPKAIAKSASHNVTNMQNRKADADNNNAQFDTKLNNNNLYYAAADFVSVNDGEISLVSGQQYKLLDMAEGWWYVSSGDAAGWAPASYLKNTQTVINSVSLQHKNTSSKMELKMSITDSNSQLTSIQACANFVAENEGELNLLENEEVVVLDQQDGGWWYVQANGNEGWVPSSYLKVVNL